jgi:hypothetical protein
VFVFVFVFVLLRNAVQRDGNRKTWFGKEKKCWGKWTHLKQILPMKCDFFSKEVCNLRMYESIHLSVFISVHKNVYDKKNECKSNCVFSGTSELSNEISDATLLALWSCFNQTKGKFEFLIKCYVKRLCVYSEKKNEYILEKIKKYSSLWRTRKKWTKLENPPQYKK